MNKEILEMLLALAQAVRWSIESDDVIYIERLERQIQDAIKGETK
jgi:hypothetical protein